MNVSIERGIRGTSQPSYCLLVDKSGKEPSKYVMYARREDLEKMGSDKKIDRVQIQPIKNYPTEQTLMSSVAHDSGHDVIKIIKHRPADRFTAQDLLHDFEIRIPVGSK